MNISGASAFPRRRNHVFGGYDATLAGSFIRVVHLPSAKKIEHDMNPLTSGRKKYHQQKICNWPNNTGGICIGSL
ncbi:MAG TPA: hypothetical protein VFF11_02960 [Candidatus Binatia bacterium]|nr:hypothetical protein [Candidatus Binatia bacterium]